ncbi:MAG: sigma-70 family RNA polymerase sigma factor [Proteobacteria bacterium]|nr:sigma-70 family RNA polymerase sigma factor [Pseudomonadota bacterium]
MSAAEQHARDEHRWSRMMVASNQGDRQAYHQLLTEVAVVIESYLRLRFGAINVLEDCVQECLLALHNARNTYDPKRAFRPWMFTIVRHKTIDILRKTKRQVQIDGIFADEQSGVTDPGHLMRLIDGVRVLNMLSPDHREAVALTKYAGYTVPEAATWLGISESAVKARLHRGLLAIRKHLEAEELPI